MEYVGTAGSEIQGHVNVVFLDHVPDRRDHGHAAVLKLGILPPLDASFVGILEDIASQGGALVSGLDGDAEGLVDQGIPGH